MKPPKSILDRDFPYVPAHKSDITKSWERARAQLEKDRQEREQKVRVIKQIGVRK